MILEELICRLVERHAAGLLEALAGLLSPTSLDRVLSRLHQGTRISGQFSGQALKRRLPASRMGKTQQI